VNNLEKLFESSAGIEEYSKGYFKYLYQLLLELDTSKIKDLVEVFDEAYEKQNNIFVIGNGGSAGTASHMANDIGFDVIKKSKCPKPFRVLSLTDCNPLMTAIANDNGYDNLFVDQLSIHFRPGDKLIVISASGNSANIIKAVEWAKAKGVTIIGLLGFDGGKLKGLCNIPIIVKTPHGEYGPVEDVHLILDHLIATWLQYKMRPGKAK
jgi:D-sedoheptulose 7-phosphate isomerase